jgi:hypothetical protein
MKDCTKKVNRGKKSIRTRDKSQITVKFMTFRIKMIKTIGRSYINMMQHNLLLNILAKYHTLRLLFCGIQLDDNALATGHWLQW